MAATNVTNTEIFARDTLYSLEAGVDINATDGAYFDAEGHSNQILVILTNTDTTNAENVVFKKGTDERFGVCDLTVSLPANGVKAIVLDTSYYMIMSGANKGKIHVTASADVEIQVVRINH